MTTLNDSYSTQDSSHYTNWSQIELSRIAPPSRSGATFSYINNKAYLFGGRTDHEYSAELHIYDPVKNTWYYTKCYGDVPAARRGHSCIVIDNMLVLFGGENKVSCSNEIFLFDPSQDRWKTLITTGEPPSPRYGHGMTFVNGKYVLIFGGISRISGQRVHHNDLYALDLEKLCWHRCEIDISCGIPIERYGHTFTSVNGKIICYGGFSTNGRLRDMWELNFVDINDSSWSRVARIGKTEPPARTEHLSFSLGKYLIIFGGSMPSSSANDLWIFDTESCHWSCINNGIEAPPARFSAAGFLFEDSLIVFGGRDKISLSDMWQCNISMLCHSASASVVQSPDKKSVQKLHTAIGSTKASLQIDEDSINKISEKFIEPLKNEIHGLKKHIETSQTSYLNSIDQNNTRYTILNEKYDRSLQNFENQLTTIVSNNDDTRTILDQFIAKTQSDILNDNASLSNDIVKIGKKIDENESRLNLIESEISSIKNTDPALSVENIQVIVDTLNSLETEDSRIENLVASGLEAIRAESTGRIADVQRIEKLLTEHSATTQNTLKLIASSVQDLCSRISSIERESGLETGLESYDELAILAPPKKRRENVPFAFSVQNKLDEFIQQNGSFDQRLSAHNTAIEGLQAALRNFSSSTHFKLREIFSTISSPQETIDVAAIEAKISDVNEMLDHRFGDLAELLRAEAEARIKETHSIKNSINNKASESLGKALEAKVCELDIELKTLRKQYIDQFEDKIESFSSDFQSLKNKTEEASQTASELARSAVTQMELDMSESKIIEKYVSLSKSIEEIRNKMKPAPMMSTPPPTPKKVFEQLAECPPSVNLLNSENDSSDSFFTE